MKYVAFLAPDEFWHGLDWVYRLMENKSDYEFFLVEAKTPNIVLDKVADIFYRRNKTADAEYIIERAFDAFSGLEYENDQEIFDYFGEKDGKTVFEFYEKYTWDSFIDGKISFYDSSLPKALTAEDREKFFNFDEENLEKLYKKNIKSNVLCLPISKELK